MNRYRALTNPPHDDTTLEESDVGFIGVNEYDQKENLQQGQVQEAVNIEFSLQGANTRGGFVCLPSVALAPLSLTWTSRVSAADRDWFGITFGNGIFVAVASDGAATDLVQTSVDGITWTSRTVPTAKSWRSVAYGNGIFVAVDSSASGIYQAISSPDGINWTNRATPVANVTWNSVAYGNGIFVAVGYSGGSTSQVMNSLDGINWVHQTPSQAAGNWTGVAYGGGLFVAVSSTGGLGGSIMYSADGVTWANATGAASSGWLSIAYGANVFCAVAGSGTNRVQTSPDGITWTAQSAAAAQTWESVTYGAGLFVSVSFSGGVQLSRDGVTWALSTAAVANQWFGVAFGAGVFAAVSNSGTGNRVMTAGYSTLVYASGIYSDPVATTTPWTVLVGPNRAGFYAFGQTTRSVGYPAGVTISQQSTVVQANNFLFIFGGPDQAPLRWDGTWGGAFIVAPPSTLGVGFEDIPASNQATYSQNRLWVMQGKDTVSASQILDFANFNVLTSVFNLNVGSSDYVVTSYPFGDTALVVFKNRSIYLLNGTSGTLANITNTEITRQLGIIGINACVSNGPDIIYMSDRNISSIRLNLQNKLQGVTQPLSRNIPTIISRVNWAYAYKVSMAFWNNQLFVALPLDNSTVCNAIVVYNFILDQWYGEWNFDATLNMSIQGFVVNNYLGRIALHLVTEDGRIFAFEGGANDISGTVVAQIATSLTTRAYRLDNNSHVPRRMYADIATNRPNYTVTAFSDGVSESSVELANQTYSRSQSWLFNDAPYTMSNANDDYNRAFRKDYSTGPDSVQCGSGFLPEVLQTLRMPLISRRKGRLSWFSLSNSQGVLQLNGIGMEARPGDRSSLTQVG